MTTLNHKKIASWAITILVITFGLMANTELASANSRGQCTPSGRAVTTTTQFAKNLAGERVTSQAAKVFRSAGYSQRDGSVATWLRRDTVVVNLASSARIQNYGCRNGRLFSAGRKTLRAGTSVVVSLPAQYGKGNFSTKRTKVFSVRRVVSAKFVGQTSCSNPGSGIVKVVIWVAPPVKAKPKPKPKPTIVPKPTPAPVTVSCPGGSVWNGVQCVVQSNANATQQTAEQQCSAIVNGVWNGSQCVITQNNTTTQTNTNTNTTTNICSNVNSPGATVNCTTPPTPPVPEKPAPTVQADGSPAHIYVNGNVQVFFRTTKGASLSVTTAGPIWVAGLREVSTTWNGQACPTNTTCWQATAWATANTGQATVTATASLNGKTATTSYQFPVVADDF